MSNGCGDSALILLNGNLNNQGTLANGELIFQSSTLTYRVTFSGFSQYQIERSDKGQDSFFTIGFGMTIDEATNAMQDYLS